MKRISLFGVILALLLLLSACAQGDLSDAEANALRKASDYFSWSLQSLGEEYTIAYESEVRIELGGKSCYLFRAESQDERVLVYAAVPEDASTLWTQFTPEAPWQEVSAETQAEVTAWVEGVG